MKIYPLKKSKPFIKVLVYGKPGVGKTTFAASAQDHPELRDVLVINVEGGLLSVSDKNLLVADVGRNDDASTNGKTMQDVEDVAWNIFTRKPGYEKIKTVVVDSLTELQARDLEDLVAKGRERKPKKPDGTLRTADEIFQEDYGQDTARMRRIFRMLRDAPINLVCTALTKSVMPANVARGQTAEPIEVLPNLTNKVGESLMGYMDFVWFFYKDADGNRAILTQTKGVYQAKTRYDKFQQAIGTNVKNPNLPDLYNTLCKVLEE